MRSVLALPRFAKKGRYMSNTFAKGMTVMSQFMEGIIKKAKENKKTIVLPEGNDPRVVKAGAEAFKQGIANIIILGAEADVKKVAAGEGVDLSGITIIDPAQNEHYDEFVTTLYEMRKAKGLTEDAAKEMVKNRMYFGCLLVKKGLADGMVGGATCATADLLRPGLQILRTAPGTKLVSAFFVMCSKDPEFGSNGTLVFADCGLNINPNADELSEIAISSANTFKALIGDEPRVAMLSFSTYGSAKHEMVEKVTEATRLAKEKAPSLNLDGELQLDAAIVESIGQSKAPGSPVAGKANVLVFPDLNAGNIGYKLTQRFGHAEAYGPVLQGIAKPVNDLSRGCSAEDVTGVIAITCVQAQMCE